MLEAIQLERERVGALVESAAIGALDSHSEPAITGAEVWKRSVEGWCQRGVMERRYSSRKRATVPSDRPRRKLTDKQRAKLPPKAETGKELIELAQRLSQDRAMTAKAVEMWDEGMSSGAVRQVHCSRIGWVRQCKHGHLWHRVFRCGLRFCPLCMSSVYESLFHEAFERLDPVAGRLIPDWPVAGHRPFRVIAKIDFTVRNTGQMPRTEEVRAFNRAIRRFFVRLARRNCWQKDTWGATWCAEFGPGNTNLHAHAVFCGPWIDQKGREASALWSEVVGEFAIVSIKVAKSFQHALRHAIKYPAASWKYFSASPQRLAVLEKAFYTVRRLHCVGAFYNPPRDVKVPPTILSPYDKCPTCGSRLEELKSPRWFSFDELMRMGSRDFSTWQREQRLLERERKPKTGPP